jgi:uncharacterized protein YkwD
VSSRWCRVAAELSLLGVLGIAACGREPQVVAPSETAAPPSTGIPVPPADDAPAEDQAFEAAGASTTSTTAAVTTTAVETTLPETTTSSTPASTTSTTFGASGGVLEGAAAESLAFVNQRRAESGLPALEADPDLTAMAEGWAQQIAADQNLRHNPNLGEEAPDDYTSIGENVGYAPSAGMIDQGWWESEGHRENILRSSFQAIGIAFVLDGDGTTWGVQVFAGS